MPKKQILTGDSHPKTHGSSYADYTPQLRIDKALDNLDAETVAITADHGEAFGEYGVYRHPLGVPHPQIKRVPWTITTAKDTETYDPSFEPARERKEVSEVLEEMGYEDEDKNEPGAEDTLKREYPMS